MRCLSCNAALTDFEATRKSAITNQFIDLCNHCFASVSDDILTIDRGDLDNYEAEETEDLQDTHSGFMDNSIDNHS